MPQKSSFRDRNLIILAELRDHLLGLMQPDVLKNLASLLEAMGGDKNAFVHQFRTWLENNGEDCRYAAMAKNFFLQDQAENVAEMICTLYHEWAKAYEKKGK